MDLVYLHPSPVTVTVFYHSLKVRGLRQIPRNLLPFMGNPKHWISQINEVAP